MSRELDGRVAAAMHALAADPNLTGAGGSTVDRVFDALLRRHREYTRQPVALFRRYVTASVERVRARTAALSVTGIGTTNTPVDATISAIARSDGSAEVGHASARGAEAPATHSGDSSVIEDRSSAAMPGPTAPSEEGQTGGGCAAAVSGSEPHPITGLKRRRDGGATRGRRVPLGGGARPGTGDITGSSAAMGVADPTASGAFPSFELPPYVRPWERYADIGGVRPLLRELRELLEYPLRHPEIFTHLGVPPPTGVLLHGPPGVGKTLLARAIAGELGVYFRSIDGPEIVGSVSGESERRLRLIFEDAAAHAPSLIFIDELDAIAPRRDSTSRGMERRIVSQLFACMDALASGTRGDAADGGARARPAVMVLAATSRPDGIDVGLRRAGRFDRELAVPIPDEAGREEILRLLAGKMRLAGPAGPSAVAGDTVVALDSSSYGKLTAESVASSTTTAAGAIIDRPIGIIVSEDAVNVPNLQSIPIPCDTTVQSMVTAVATTSIHANTETFPPGGDSNADVSMATGVDGGMAAVASASQSRADAADVVDDAMRAISTAADTAAAAALQSFDFRAIARAAPGYVGADLCALTKEAAVCAVNRAYAALFNNADTGNISLGGGGSGGNDPISTARLAGLAVTFADFESALQRVQPSATREGFVTAPSVSWADVGALDGVRAELEMAIVQPLRRPQLFAALGIGSPAGVLLYGPPGCGKTLLAKAIAAETAANFIGVKGPELLDKYVGESEAAVRRLFARARASAPCVVFFDELDALAPRRGGPGGAGAGGGNVTERVVNQLLTELDGLEARRDVFVVAATNRPDIIDPAMLRPGRLDKLLYVPLPTAEERARILATQTRRTPLADDVDLTALACHSRCARFSGADLAGLVREAAVSALREYLASPACAAADAAASAVDGGVRVNDASQSIQVYHRHFVDALGRAFPSVSPNDERLYNNMTVRLRNSRSHLATEAEETAKPAAAVQPSGTSVRGGDATSGAAVEP